MLFKHCLQEPIFALAFSIAAEVAIDTITTITLEDIPQKPNLGDEFFCTAKIQNANFSTIPNSRLGLPELQHFCTAKHFPCRVLTEHVVKTRHDNLSCNLE